MSNLMISRAVTGPDNALITKDVYEVVDNTVDGAGSEGSEGALGSPEDNPKPPIAPVKTPPTEESSAPESAVSELSKSFESVDAARLVAGLNDLSENAARILGDTITNPNKASNLAILQKELLMSNNLISKDSRRLDVTGEVIKGIWGDAGKAPDPNCRSLSSLFGGDTSDWGASLLLNLMLLAKMIECGIKDGIAALMDSVDNPIVKNGLALLGTSTFFNNNTENILSNRLNKGRVSYALGDTKNPFSEVLNPPKTKIAKRFSTPPSTTGTGVVINDFYKNDISQTPLTKEQASKIRNERASDYGVLVDNIEESLSTSDQLRLTGYREEMANSNQPSGETGIDIEGLLTLTSYVEATDIKDAYPTIVEDTFRYYRLPNTGEFNLADEYNKLITVATRFEADFPAFNNNVGVTCLKAFAEASRDCLVVFACHTESVFKNEAMIAKSYFSNNIIRLIERQHPYIKI